ncbi:transcriptional regulator, partial [Mycobacterium tuberculosis]|nr:transcriptional regulator [Mycobacterium tuberculosis]
IDPSPVIRQRPRSRQAQELRWARCCYDHLAGQLGVAVTRGLQARNFIVEAPDKQFAVTPAGNVWLAGMGLSVAQLKASRRGVA